jgi:hypothetical protein
MTKNSFDSTDLPVLQSRTHCVLIPRDPNFIYAYWDYTQKDIDKLRNQLKFEGGDSQLIVRVYDITRIRFNGSNANHTWDLDVGYSTKNWHIHVWQDSADYCTELGMRYGENYFIPLIRSNTVRTPPKTASKRNDLIWQDIKAHRESQPYLKENLRERYQSLMQQSKKKFHKVMQSRKARIYQLTAQDIRDYYMKLFSSMSRKGRNKGKLKGVSWQKVRPILTFPDLLGRTQGASEILSSLQSGASEGRLIKKDFFFEIWTEMIVHGRTEPDARVFLNQQEIKLNPDGTFSLRYALPDGEIPLKFIAKSSDGTQQHHIDTRVEREKTCSSPKTLGGSHG